MEESKQVKTRVNDQVNGKNVCNIKAGRKEAKVNNSGW